MKSKIKNKRNHERIILLTVCLYHHNASSLSDLITKTINSGIICLIFLTIYLKLLFFYQRE